MSGGRGASDGTKSLAESVAKKTVNEVFDENWISIF